MNIIMTDDRMRQMAKRLRKVLRGLGVELRHTDCLNLAANLCGIENWKHFCQRNPDEPLSPLDEEVSEEEFTARNAFQMSVLTSAGLGEVARELLDRANPTGSWARQFAEEQPGEMAGNDPAD